MSQRLGNKGFTILELIIVIVVIGILATVVIVAFNGVKQKATIATLTSDLDGINKQLSVDSVDRSGNFADSLDDLNGGSGVQYRGSATLMYTPYNDNDPQDYCLTAVLGDIAYNVTRYTSPAPGYCPGDEPVGVPDAPTIQTNSDSTSQITVSWDAVDNADSYILKRSLSPTMSSPTVVNNITTTSRTVTGLSSNTTYYFTLAAVGSAGTGPESAVVDETTQLSPPAGAPTIAAAVNSPSQITISWGAVAGSASYKIDRSTSSSFSSPTTVTGITGTSKAITGLSAGTRYYFRAYAVNGAGVTSAASNSVNAITTISAPDSPTVAVTIPGSTRAASSGPWAKTPDGDPTSGTWYYAKAALSSSTCASGTTREFRARIQYSSPQSYGAWTSWTTSTSFYAIQPVSPYGIRFSVQSHCKTSLVTSSASSTGYGCRYQNGSTSCSAF